MTHKPFYKLNLCLLLGLTVGVISLLSHFYLPLLVQETVLQQFILQPDSATYPKWKRSTIPIYGSYYLFNVTNADRAFKNGTKPVLQELGPYVFKQVFEKVNVSWNDVNGTVEYQQVKRWVFVPSLTSASLDDEVVHINVPLISAIGQISQMSFNDPEKIYNSAEQINSIVDAFTLKTFLRTKVRHLLFDGYDDKLLEVASSFYPDKVNQTKFGWLFGQNGSSTDGLYRIFTGQQSHGLKLGLVDTWNGANTIGKCQSLNHTITGDLQPPFFLLQGLPLLNYLTDEEAFRPPQSVNMLIADMCRTFRLDYKMPVTFKGISGFRYYTSPATFDNQLDENLCFCQDRSCPPDGLYELGECAKGTPIFVSHPHFLNGHPSLFQNVYGLRPSPERHEFTVDFEKKMGITMNVNARFQLNLLVMKKSLGKHKGNPIDIEILTNWTENMEIYLPQFWFDTSASIDDDLVSQLSFLTQTLPLILFVTPIAFALIALVFLAYVLIYTITNHVYFTLTHIPKYESVSMLETKPSVSEYETK